MDILSEFDMVQCKPAPTPLDVWHKLALSNSDALSDPLQYRHFVGKLIYLGIIHPDLTYVVHVLSQCKQCPLLGHLNNGKRVLRYLMGSPGQGLFYAAESDSQL